PVGRSHILQNIALQEAADRTTEENISLMNCTDPKIGRLLEAYEFGLLSEAERRQFDEHLLDCDYCAQDVFQTMPVVEALENNRDRFKTTLQAEPEKKYSWLDKFLAYPLPIKALVYSCLAILIAAGLVFWNAQRPAPPPEDLQPGSYRGEVNLIEPKGDIA